MSSAVHPSQPISVRSMVVEDGGRAREPNLARGVDDHHLGDARLVPRRPTMSCSPGRSRLSMAFSSATCSSRLTCSEALPRSAASRGLVRANKEQQECQRRHSNAHGQAEQNLPAQNVQSLARQLPFTRLSTDLAQGPPRRRANPAEIAFAFRRHRCVADVTATATADLAQPNARALVRRRRRDLDGAGIRIRRRRHRIPCTTTHKRRDRDRSCRTRPGRPSRDKRACKRCSPAAFGRIQDWQMRRRPSAAKAPVVLAPPPRPPPGRVNAKTSAGFDRDHGACCAPRHRLARARRCDHHRRPRDRPSPRYGARGAPAWRWPVRRPPSVDAGCAGTQDRASARPPAGTHIANRLPEAALPRRRDAGHVRPVLLLVAGFPRHAHAWCYCRR